MKRVSHDGTVFGVRDIKGLRGGVRGLLRDGVWVEGVKHEIRPIMVQCVRGNGLGFTQPRAR